MWLTRVLQAVKTHDPIVKKHSNEFTGIFKEKIDHISWNRRRFKMMNAHMYGRNRNCYKIGISVMHKNLQRLSGQRKAYRKDFQELCDLRIESSGKELHYNDFSMRETLARLHIGLNRKVLANLAIWEPRTFRSIVGLCAHKESLPEDQGGLDKPKSGPGTEVISRGRL